MAVGVLLGTKKSWPLIHFDVTSGSSAIRDQQEETHTETYGVMPGRGIENFSVKRRSAMGVKKNT